MRSRFRRGGLLLDAYQQDGRHVFGVVVLAESIEGFDRLFHPVIGGAQSCITGGESDPAVQIEKPTRRVIDTQRPFDPAHGVAGKIKKAAMAEGLICYPMSGTRDGKNGDHILLAPPFIIEEAQIDELVSKLAKAIDATLPV